MIYGSLDSSHQDASNGSKFISLGSMDDELFTKSHNIKSTNNSLTINIRGMNLLPLDAS